MTPALPVARHLGPPPPGEVCIDLGFPTDKAYTRARVLSEPDPASPQFKWRCDRDLIDVIVEVDRCESEPWFDAVSRLRGEDLTAVTVRRFFITPDGQTKKQVLKFVGSVADFEVTPKWGGSEIVDFAVLHGKILPIRHSTMYTHIKVRFSASQVEFHELQ